MSLNPGNDDPEAFDDEDDDDKGGISKADIGDDLGIGDRT